MDAPTATSASMMHVQPLAYPQPTPQLLIYQIYIQGMQTLQSSPFGDSMGSL